MVFEHTCSEQILTGAHEIGIHACNKASKRDGGSVSSGRFSGSAAVATAAALEP